MSLVGDIRTIAETLPLLLAAQAETQVSIEQLIQILKQDFDPIVGIEIEEATPPAATSRPASSTRSKERPMAKAKAKSVKLVKRQIRGSTPTKRATPGDPINDFQFVDNGSGSYAVEGVSAAGNPADISAIATLTVTSDDPSIVAVDPPVAFMSFGLKAVGPVTSTPVTITVTATWNDGSVGPFVFTAPATVVPGTAVGIQVVQLGTPVVA